MNGLPVWPIHQVLGVKRVVVSTFTRQLVVQELWPWQNLSNKRGMCVSNRKCKQQLVDHYCHKKKYYESHNTMKVWASSLLNRHFVDDYRDWTNADPITQDVFGRQYSWNLFSHNSIVQENGYNEEENKMINETSKIFGQHIPVAVAVSYLCTIPRIVDRSVKN